jgi:hypothetical protein
MLSGDSKPWRDLGHTRIRDDLAVLENTKSPEFQEAVHKEQDHWEKALTPFHKEIPVLAKEFHTLIDKALPKEIPHETMMWNGVDVCRRYGLSHRLDVWMQVGTHCVRMYRGLKSFGLDRSSTLYYTIEDVGNGSEDLQLSVYSLTQKKPLWQCKEVGETAGFEGERCVYTLIENHGRSYCIVTADKDTGLHAHRIFEEKDKRFQVSLVVQTQVFVHLANALSQQIGLVQDNRIRWMTPAPAKDARGRGTTLIPVTDRIYLTNTALHVVGSGYHPLPHGFGVDAMPIQEAVLIVTVSQGCSSLYVFSLKSERFNCLYKGTGPCEIHLQQWTTDPSVRISTPDAPTSLFEVVGFRKPTLKRRYTFPEPVRLGVYHHGVAKSRDGTPVPYTFVSHHKQPKRLLVEAYGAYGTSARRSYPIHWLPWLAKGYAIGVAMPRGGRDDGDAWYDGGRTPAQKHHTFEDTAAVVETLQHRFRISSDKTVFYGRSAGGWVAAQMAQAYPNLFRVVYTEVPYVDVLRTTSNPALPLTQLEYDEFGDPRSRADYDRLITLSPMETIPDATPQSPTIIVKTGLNDVQVLPYETLKWAHRLRDKGWTVFAGIDSNGGHFAEEKDLYTQKAEDFELIESFMSVPRGSKCLFCKTRRAKRI